jgi:ACS family glucarate transporter-like MFS transporter
MGKPAELPLQRPSWVRWRIVALLMALSFMSHFHRNSMSVAGTEHIIPEFSISPTQMGLVYSAFLLTYTLCMTPGGWFADRFGSRAALFVMSAGSAVFGALTGLTGFLFAGSAVLFVLLVVRGLMGIVNAPMYPSSARMVAHWLPPGQRAWANGLINGAAPFGIAMANLLFAFLMDAVGWRNAFVLTGLFTAVLAALWIGCTTDFPSQHPRVNAEEWALLRSPGKRVSRKEAKDGGRGGWQHLLGNRNLLLLTVSYAAVGYFEYLLAYWMEYYFKEVLKFDRIESRFYAAVAIVAMGLGMFLGGWASDRLTKAYGPRIGRSLVPVLGMIASGVLLYAGISATEAGWIVLCFALALAAIGACEGPFWTVAVEVGGARGATSAGICNTGGNLGGILATSLTPVFGEYLGWFGGLSLGSLVCLIGAVLWLWIDPSKKSSA